jgi:alginate O-acetyltransferase complex protein AlgI
MLFTTHIFLFGFLPIVLAGFWALRSMQLRLSFLALASYVFYAWWDWRFLPLLLASTTTDYIAGLLLSRSNDPRVRRALLIGALSINLGLLALFKYAGFFLASGNGLASLVGAGRPLPSLAFLLPIGISFYTFNSISYTIDVYRRLIPADRDLLRYATFVALFPHLIAGPIVRYSSIRGQLERLAPRLTSSMATSGLTFLACGLVKKLLIADTLAPTVDRLFAGHAHLGLVSAWVAALGYALQLYFDFSGYSDMAVGLALLLGIRFPRNFDSPYKATSIADFWRRWHISLSTFLRDYLFIPLGGSRAGPLIVARNLTIVMLLGGLWHGAAWTFVVWGAAHGVLLAGHALLRQRGWTPPWQPLNRALTFIAVVAAFVVFRAHSIGDAADVLTGMLGANGLRGALPIDTLLWPGVLIGALLVFVNVAPDTWDLRFRLDIRSGLVVGMALAVAVLAISGPSPFLYYQF